MPLYNDLIRIEGEYNYSANIQFDMENDRKLLRFIPNETIIELLKEFFVDITRANPSHHARILYGSYGTGKSHFLTVLSMLLEKIYTDGIAYNTFLSRVSGYDEGLAKDIDNYIKDEKRKPLLIVPIVFDFDDFDRCIYFSLKKKLDSIGKKVCFKTFFDQAINLIRQWKESSESAARLSEACRKTNIDLALLEESLKGFNKKAEASFQKVFSEMTYGVKYIYEVANIAENISQANESISDEYSGIVFVFDEFGRYIEDNIRSIKVKAVQDLAEFCDHSAGNNHIILVSHKEIGLYTQRYGKSIATEWKKVEGRYKSTPINDKQDQCLSLIRNILQKDDATWTIFKNRYSRELGKMYAEASDFRGFLIDAAQGKNPFEGGFPLHPISLYALDKLSKRVAQNERTFFTYLASKDDNSLYRFLNCHDLEEFHFVGIDEIFDYFEPSIKATQSDVSYEWYKELQTALSKSHSSIEDDTPETKILKVIATIGIINDSSALVANRSTIISVIDCPNDVLSNSIDGLCEQKIIKYSGAYDRYDFFEASIFDVEGMIEEESQSVSDDAVTSVLNEEYVDFALYPYRYNRIYKITRVFIPVFATVQDVQRKSFLTKFGKYYDGLLILLLADQDTNSEELSALSKELPKSIILSTTDTFEIKRSVKRYIAVKYLESQKAKYSSQDPAFEKELAYYKEELHLSILGLIQELKSHFNASSTVAVDGEIKDNLMSFEDLASVASKIMEKYYPNTLIVNNELINKNTISGSISSAKKNVIANMIKGSKATDYYDVVFLSPDYIAIRSVLVKNGFIATPEEISCNELPDGNMPQNQIQAVITSFINRAKVETVPFEDVFITLKEPPFGLRNGYLSLLLAHILIPYRKSLIISSHGVEQELNVDLFEEIVRRPHDFSFTIAAWDQDQIDYLDALQQLFEEYINSASLGRNRLKAIYDAIMSHYKNASKFARTTQNYVSDETKAYRKILEKSTANYSTFLFAKLKNIGEDYSGTVNAIKKIKAEIDDAIAALVRDLALSITELFGAKASTPIASIFSSLYDSQWKNKRSKSFDYYTNSFLEMASKTIVNENDYDIILRFSKALTGFELLYWNDSHKKEFVDRLSEIKSKLDSYQENTKLGETETQIIMRTATGDERSVVFDRTELNTLSQTVRNKIQATFKNYGLAVSYDDKVQILLSLLEDMMEGK